MAFLFTCRQRNTQQIVEDLSGSWHSCLDGESYIEYHFTKNHAIGFLEDAIGLTYVYPYSTFQDTLVVYNDMAKRFFSNRYELNTNSLLLYREGKTPIKLIRFSKYSVFPLEGCNLYGKKLDSITLKHYEYMFNKRKEAFLCEKVDSLSMPIPIDSIDTNFEDLSILKSP